MRIEQTCKICKETKSINEFPRIKPGRVCKKCTCNRSLEYYKKHYETILKQGEGTCRHCHKTFPAIFFNKHNTFCANCRKIKHKQYTKKSKVKAKLKQNNCTIEKYNELQKIAGNKCMICNETKTELLLDHCHITKKIRGLLCSSCNTGLGFFKDNINYLLNAIIYLKKP